MGVWHGLSCLFSPCFQLGVELRGVSSNQQIIKSVLFNCYINCVIGFMIQLLDAQYQLVNIIHTVYIAKYITGDFTDHSTGGDDNK